MYDYKLTAEQKERAQRNVEIAKHYPRTIVATAEESFGEKLKRAVTRRKEQAQQRQPKYRKPVRRPHTKGE